MFAADTDKVFKSASVHRIQTISHHVAPRSSLCIHRAVVEASGMWSRLSLCPPARHRTVGGALPGSCQKRDEVDYSNNPNPYLPVPGQWH